MLTIFEARSGPHRRASVLQDKTSVGSLGTWDDFFLDYYQARANNTAASSLIPIPWPTSELWVKRGLSAETARRCVELCTAYQFIANLSNLSLKQVDQFVRPGLTFFGHVDKKLRVALGEGPESVGVDAASPPGNDFEAFILAFASFFVLLRYKTGDCRHAEQMYQLVVLHHDAIGDALSSPSMWRADGTIAAEKARRVLSSKISADFQKVAYYDSIAKVTGAGPTGARKAVVNTGLDFEKRLEDILALLGILCERTPTSGDYGVDLVAIIANERTAIQVKDHAAAVGVAAVMEVTAGAHHYNCSRSLVVARSEFTENAIELAHSTGTKLLTERQLIALLRSGVSNFMG